MNLDKLENILKENNQPKFRLDQIVKAIYKDGTSSFSEITTLSKELREILDKEISILSFRVKKVLRAKPARNATHSVAGGDGQSIKVLFELHDGNLMESVLIAPKPGLWSACISCQVGCAMGCRFCATGKIGLKRNLTAEEITDQILFWRQYLKKEKITGNFSNIIYMGMGEPFANWKEVSESIRNLTDEKTFGFGSRSLSVSTSGLASGILKLAQEFPQVNLAISLHFAGDEKRADFMPINKKDNLEVLRIAIRQYLNITNRKVFLEYILLDGINDSREDANILADYVHSIGKLQLLHVNLIRYNTTGEFHSASKSKTYTFKQELEKRRINSTIRKSLGEEIQGACGQLAGR